MTMLRNGACRQSDQIHKKGNLDLKQKENESEWIWKGGRQGGDKKNGSNSSSSSSNSLRLNLHNWRTQQQQQQQQQKRTKIDPTVQTNNIREKHTKLRP